MHPTGDRLKAIPLFSDLHEDDLSRLATWFTVEETSEGTRLTPEGASGYRFFVIAEGTAEVRQHHEPIAALGAGEFFGEMAIMGDGRRVADVVATSPMTLFAMFGTEFREMEATLPAVAARITETLKERLPTP
jgi:CRP-like cAMP-binding protein